MSEEEPPEDPKRERVSSRRSTKSPLQEADYERLVQAYLVGDHRTVRGLAKATGYSEETASRAISKGWPERNWSSLKDRAALYDAQRRKNQETFVPEGVIADAQRWRALKEENLRTARGIRVLMSNLAAKVQAAVGDATAERLGVRVRVVDELRGKRVVQKVVKENFVMPPYLPHLASALRDLATLGFEAGRHERMWLGVEPPVGTAERVGFDQLTDEQLDAVIQGGGRLPDGVTLEMLRGRGQQG